MEWIHSTLLSRLFFTLVPIKHDQNMQTWSMVAEERVQRGRELSCQMGWIHYDTLDALGLAELCVGLGLLRRPGWFVW